MVLNVTPRYQRTTQRMFYITTSTFHAGAYKNLM